MKTKRYWIKERNNPQLGIYYSAAGQLSDTAAKRMEKSLYGHNIMLPFDTEEEYKAKLAQLNSDGERVH